MTDQEFDALLTDTLGSPEPAPNYLNLRLQGALALKRKEGKSIILWWIPLAAALVVAGCSLLLTLVFPFPLNLLVFLSAGSSLLLTATLTVVGLVCFDLHKKGRVFL